MMKTKYIILFAQVLCALQCLSINIALTNEELASIPLMLADATFSWRPHRDETYYLLNGDEFKLSLSSSSTSLSSFDIAQCCLSSSQSVQEIKKVHHQSNTTTADEDVSSSNSSISSACCEYMKGFIEQAAGEFTDIRSVELVLLIRSEEDIISQSKEFVELFHKFNTLVCVNKDGQQRRDVCCDACLIPNKWKKNQYKWAMDGVDTTTKGACAATNATTNTNVTDGHINSIRKEDNGWCSDTSFKNYVSEYSKKNTSSSTSEKNSKETIVNKVADPSTSTSTATITSDSNEQEIKSNDQNENSKVPAETLSLTEEVLKSSPTVVGGEDKAVISKDVSTKDNLQEVANTIPSSEVNKDSPLPLPSVNGMDSSQLSDATQMIAQQIAALKLELGEGDENDMKVFALENGLDPDKILPPTQSKSSTSIATMTTDTNLAANGAAGTQGSLNDAALIADSILSTIVPKMSSDEASVSTKPVSIRNDPVPKITSQTEINNILRENGIPVDDEPALNGGERENHGLRGTSESKLPELSEGTIVKENSYNLNDLLFNTIRQPKRYYGGLLGDHNELKSIIDNAASRYHPENIGPIEDPVTHMPLGIDFLN